MLAQANKVILSEKRQRTLRSNMTDAETALLRVLRGRQVSGIKFRRQHPFDDYILDFVSLEIKLVIELDGGQHGEQTEYDGNRTKKLETAGFHVLRFWNNEALENTEAVAEKIWMVVQERQKQKQPHPHPNPPLEGEGTKGKGVHVVHPPNF